MGFLKKIWRTKNYRVAFVLALVMFLWLASGLLRSGSDADQIETPDNNTSRALVEAKVLEAQDLPLSVSVRGRTEPNRHVDVKAEIAGAVVGLPIEKGEYVKTGDVICELAEEDRAERLQQSKAALDKAQIDFEGAQRLQNGGFQSRSDIAQAEANLVSARATYRRAQLDLANLEVRAPFDGFVDARPVELGDFMQRGEICAVVLDVDPLLLTGRVSEKDVTHISVGNPVEATLVYGARVEGTVRFVERSADEVTRTFRMEAVVPNPDLTLQTGVSARLEIPVAVVKAHLIHSSLLSLDDEGGIGVKFLDSDDRVKYLGVELIADDAEGVWVSGLPETVKLITVGQQYVAEGDLVEVSLEEPTSTLGITGE